MERDPVESLLSEFVEWAGKQHPPVQSNSEDAEILLVLLDRQSALDFGRLRPTDLEELLLVSFPSSVDYVPGEDLSPVVYTLRDLLTFAADTGRLAPQRLDDLRKKVDEIEPQFADAVVEPDGFPFADEPAGVDSTDEKAVAEWLTDYLEQDAFDLREELGLPDRLPPLRLPPDEELAATARQSPLLDRARRLAVWSTGRPLSIGELVNAEDTIAAAREFGFPVPDSASGTFPYVPGLNQLWELAAELEFIEVAMPESELGPGAEDWPDGDDEAVLDVWADALSMLLEVTFTDDTAGLELRGVASLAMVSLFLARNEGIPVDELRDMIRDVAVEEDAPDGTWESWLEERGDPAERLLKPLAELGAVQVDEGIARIAPLGQYAFAGMLTDSGVEVPVLPPVEEMTAFNLVDFAKGADDEEVVAETEAWFAVHGAASATDNLLAAAAEADAEDRMLAITIAGQHAEEAQENWRRALDDDVLRPYAKLTLRLLDSSDPALETTLTDSARLLTDMLGAALDSMHPDEAPELLAEAVPAGHEQQIFDEMWRLDHPDVREVLTLIGANHPDKTVAKAARKAALKVPPPK